ncbi:MAG: type I methionyl aminopeptidase [Thermoguttaceae bacterium]
MQSYRSALEIDRMRKAGLLVWHGLQIAMSLVRPGISTAEIDSQVERFFIDQGAVPLFKGVLGVVPFPAATCMSINEEVVHGIPSERILKEGDILSVDTGCKIFDAGSKTTGWCGDSARTFAIGEISAEKKHLLDVTADVLNLAIDEIPKHKYWSGVAKKMEKHVIAQGFSVVESLVGHGIGREMHEPPQVPNYNCPAFLMGEDFELRPGLVIAVEPMVNAGTKKVRVLRDHWTIATNDRRPSAHFEHTLAITASGVRILTGPPETEGEKIDITRYISR